MLNTKANREFPPSYWKIWELVNGGVPPKANTYWKMPLIEFCWRRKSGVVHRQYWKNPRKEPRFVFQYQGIWTTRLHVTVINSTDYKVSLYGKSGKIHESTFPIVDEVSSRVYFRQYTEEKLLHEAR